MAATTFSALINGIVKQLWAGSDGSGNLSPGHTLFDSAGAVFGVTGNELSVKGGIAIADGVTASTKATVAQFHNADDQALAGSAQGLLTGGVAQLVNPAAGVDRQRETGSDNITASGIATGTQQLKSRVSTTTTAIILINTNTTTLAATKFTNRGVAAWIGVGSILTIEPGTANQEQVRVSAVNYGTNVVTIAGIGTGRGFLFGHSSGVTVTTGAYNEAVDATIPDGSPPAGISAGASYLFNTTSNAGAGGVEFARSFAGELMGATGVGTSVAVEYRDSSGGPLLAAGTPSGLRLMPAQGVTGITRATASITSTTTGDTSIVFSSSAAAASLSAGHAIQLTGGSGPETVFTATSWVPGSSATVPIQSPVVNNAQTTASWSTFGAAGPGLLGFLPHGLAAGEECVYDPVSGLFYLERSATQDGVNAQNVVMEGPALWNGSTMDRARAVTGDALPQTGIETSVGLLWNGTAFDRPREATADALAVTGIPAQSPVVWNGTTYDRRKSVTGDALSATGIASSASLLWNGTNFDRPREATADALAVTGIAAESPVLWNGASFDRQVGNIDTAALVTLSAASAGGNSTDQTNKNGRGLQVGINITAITGTAPTLTVTVQGKDAASGVYYTLLASTALNATGFTLLTVYPASPATANVSVPAPLPRTWRILYAIGGTGPAVTATVGASVVV
jgi:hypothetical protein